MAGYVLLFSTVGYCFANFKTGPCTPNLDIASFMVAGIVCLCLLLKNLVELLRFKTRTNGYSVLVHLTATLILYLWGGF